MATSGTTTFESGLSISDIVEESYERIGITGVSGHQLKSARRSLNILFQEWANRGLHYWEVANNSITLVDGQATYTMFRSTADLKAAVQNNGINNCPVTMDDTDIAKKVCGPDEPSLKGEMPRKQPKQVIADLAPVPTMQRKLNDQGQLSMDVFLHVALHFLQH